MNFPFSLYSFKSKHMIWILESELLWTTQKLHTKQRKAACIQKIFVKFAMAVQTKQISMLRPRKMAVKMTKFSAISLMSCLLDPMTFTFNNRLLILLWSWRSVFKDILLLIMEPLKILKRVEFTYNFPIKRILCIHNKIRNKLLLITGVMKVLTVTKMVTLQSKIVDLINI